MEKSVLMCCAEQGLPTVVSQAADAIIEHQGAAEQTEVLLCDAYGALLYCILYCCTAVLLCALPYALCLWWFPVLSCWAVLVLSCCVVLLSCCSILLINKCALYPYCVVVYRSALHCFLPCIDTKCAVLDCCVLLNVVYRAPECSLP